MIRYVGLLCFKIFVDDDKIVLYGFLYFVKFIFEYFDSDEIYYFEIVFIVECLFFRCG
jgi:hypothetical protein